MSTKRIKWLHLIVPKKGPIDMSPANWFIISFFLLCGFCPFSVRKTRQIHNESVLVRGRDANRRRFLG